MDSCLKWAWLFPICWFSFLLSIAASKKPPFCDQDGDPFSFLWMIKRDPPSYLFGTIHVPYIKVWDNIPDNAKQAFAASSQVFFELDLADPATVAALSTCQMLPQGKNLSDVLPQELYGRLKRHLEYVRGMMPRWITRDKSRGRRIFKGLFNPDQRNFFNADYLFNAIAGNWERKRPVWVMLMVNSLTESDVRSRDVPVLDLYLAQEADRLRKRTAAVEKVEEQCLPLNGINISQVLFALNHILLQHEEYRREADHHQHPPPYTTVDLIRHYNCGDLLSGEAVFLGADSLPPLPPLGVEEEQEGDLARNLDRYLRRELILNRNKRMGERVAKILGNNPGESLFFAFGAGHFIGNNTILDFVQAQGYEIEHLSVNTKIPKSKSKISIRSNAPLKPGLRSYDEGTLPPTRRTGQTRRSSRQRSLAESVVYSSSGASLGVRKAPDDPKFPLVTTQRPRCFHDLWVRLDTYGRKKPNSVSGSPQDSSIPKQVFQTWYQKHEDTIHSSASRLVFKYGSSITVATVLYACSFRTHFQQIFRIFTMTGFT